MLLATLDSGNARNTVARTDAVDVARSCATIIRPLAEAHGMIFSLEANGPLELDTDPDKLREVLMNLLHNAVEYNREGGRVDFNVKRVGKTIAFEIADTGIGMPLEVREKIFERFYRADASRHATGIHAGLGLAMHYVFEGGIRMPAIVRWPRRLKGGRRVQEMLHFTDWLPTLASAAGVAVPDTVHLASHAFPNHLSHLLLVVRRPSPPPGRRGRLRNSRVNRRLSTVHA